jgi:hypothetical protein
MAKNAGPACDYCHSGALYLVTRDVPGSPAAHACKGHLAVAADKLAERTGSGSVDVYLLSGSHVLGDGDALTGQAMEQVRRIGAHSAKDPETARALEYELYCAVLVLIAQGAQNPSGLATAALQTQNYDLDRRQA